MEESSAKHGHSIMPTSNGYTHSKEFLLNIANTYTVKIVTLTGFDLIPLSGWDTVIVE